MTAIWPNYAAKNQTTVGTSGSNSSLGKDDFLKILVTQLSNQDPTQPLQDRDFIAQMAQFTSVEQLMNMSEAMSKLQQSLSSASNLIGKSVTWNQVSQDGQTMVEQSGVVSGITLKDGKQYAKVGGQDVFLDDIVEVSEVTNP